MLQKENIYLLNVNFFFFTLLTQQRTADLTEFSSNKENFIYYMFNKRLSFNLIQKT